MILYTTIELLKDECNLQPNKTVLELFQSAAHDTLLKYLL